jgi:hypothetical protein
VLALGACGGLAAWAVWQSSLRSAPVPVQFVLAFAVLVLGPGAAGGVVLARDSDAIEQCVIPTAAGLVLCPAIAQLFGELGLLSWYPSFAAVLGGIAAACAFVRRRAATAVTRTDIAACLMAALLAVAAGWVAYAHRLAPPSVTRTTHN